MLSGAFQAIGILALQTEPPIFLLIGSGGTLAQTLIPIEILPFRTFQALDDSIINGFETAIPAVNTSELIRRGPATQTGFVAVLAEIIIAGGFILVDCLTEGTGIIATVFIIARGIHALNSNYFTIIIKNNF